MKGLTTVAAVLVTSLLVIAGTAAAHPTNPANQPGTFGVQLPSVLDWHDQLTPLSRATKPGIVDVQLLTVSDWHGQLTPVNGVGGAAFLKTYFDQARAANPNTLTFMAGDSIGATPPVSSFFEDEPAIRAMNMMGVTADTFGNHNFDRGINHLQRMVDLAEFDFLSANLKNLDENLTGVEKMKIYNVGGIKVAVIGITNEEAPTLVSPGALGTIKITDSIAAANRTAAVARRAGAQVVVILTHKGIRGRDASGAAFGELVDFANGVDRDRIDVIVGDHTNFTYSGIHQGRILAVENLSKGVQFAKVNLRVDRDAGVIDKSVTFQTPTNAGATPDPLIQAFIDDLNTQLKPILGTVIGESTRAIPRSDQCGRADGRLCESLVGNVVTDALRTTYGTDFAITNSGGLRAEMTCPGAGEGGFCPPGITPPPFPITRGSVLGVLPFQNVSVTGTVSGGEIKAFLENGVSAMPAANGRFPQVSGLCFTYEISAPAGSRVTSIVGQAADGTCTGAAVVPASSYTLATNDFMAAGGDGYPVVISRMTSRNIMDQDAADYVAANSPLSPSIQGRIVCTDANGAGVSPNCPVITAP
jgi:2',3'-cyclic-nucleotide 2'-phosphodiesterase (5'-nucleotidase family)